MIESWRDDDIVSAWAAMLRLHAELVPRLDAELHRVTGMALAWYDVLLELNAAPQRQLRMFDLGEAVVLSRTRVSRVVDELVAAGYVARVPNPRDGRSEFASLTASGSKAFRRAAPVYLDLIRSHFGQNLDAADAHTLRALLDQARPTELSTD